MTTQDTPSLAQPLPSSSTPALLDTTPHLKDIAAFEHALAHYELSNSAIEILRGTPLVLLTSVTSAGRNTIINELLKTGRYSYIPSDTTRPKRLNGGTWEQDGVEYFFREEASVLADVRAGNYVGPAIIHGQQVSGINIRQIQKAKEQQKIPITDIEIVGAVDILAMAPNTVTIFPLPPSFEEWLKRIRKRSNFTSLEFSRRLKAAANEFKTALDREDIIFVINDRLYDAVAAVDGIARGAHQPGAESRAHDLAVELHRRTCQYLREHFNIDVEN